MNGSRVKRIWRRTTLVTAAALLAFVDSAMARRRPWSRKIPESRLWSPSRRPGCCPENTLALLAGCELGIDALELDVLLFGRRGAVVHHDFKLEPKSPARPTGLGSSGSQPASKT